MTALIKPIGKSLQHRVVEATSGYIDQARDLFDTDFNRVAVGFDLTGKAAGMYRVRRSERIIRYNPYIRPHGQQWQALMAAFGADPSRTCSYDMEGIPQRVHQRIAYRCDCTRHNITLRRHNQIERGRRRYFCRSCGALLVQSPVAAG